MSFKQSGQILSGLKEKGLGSITANDIHNEAITLIQTKTEDDLYELIGSNIPEESSLLLEEVGNYARNLLPAADRKLLPAPVTKEQKIELGKKFNSAIKRVVWKVLCDQSPQLVALH